MGITADGTTIRTATANRPRGIGNYGFDETVSVGAGNRRICAVAIDANSGAAKTIACQSLVVPGTPPTPTPPPNRAAIGVLDEVGVVGADVRVRGWVRDPARKEPLAIEILAGNTVVRTVTATLTRGIGNYGFDETIPVDPGRQEICVRTAERPGTSPVTIGCSDVEVIPTPPTQTRYCNGEVATLVGTDGNDTIIGTEGRDVINALRGADTIMGLGGDDVICGGRGEDQIYGGPGDDFVKGGNARDAIFGNAGDDILRGNIGQDDISGGPGTDSCSEYVVARKCELLLRPEAGRLPPA